jgi:PilZ domain
LANRPPVSCVVRDLSNHGAGLQFKSTTDIPVEFDLSFDTGAVVRQCRVAWQTRTAVGVSFQQLTEVMRQFHESRLLTVALKLVFTAVVVADLLRWRAFSR